MIEFFEEGALPRNLIYLYSSKVLITLFFCTFEMRLRQQPSVSSEVFSSLWCCRQSRPLLHNMEMTFFLIFWKEIKMPEYFFSLLYGKKGELFWVGNCFLSLPLQRFCESRLKHGCCGSRWDADDEADAASILNAFFKPSPSFSFYHRRYLRWRIANSRQWLNFCHPCVSWIFFWGLEHRFDYILFIKTSQVRKITLYHFPGFFRLWAFKAT